MCIGKRKVFYRIHSIFKTELKTEINLIETKMGFDNDRIHDNFQLFAHFKSMEHGKTALFN